MPKGYTSVIGAARGCGFKGTSGCTLFVCVCVCVFDAYCKIIEATKLYNDSVQISILQQLKIKKNPRTRQ